MKKEKIIIGVTLNDVLRDFNFQFEYTYNKYIAKTEEERIEVGSTNDLLSVDGIKFNTMDEINDFMYYHAPLEIFGHADSVGENIATHFNQLVMDTEDNSEGSAEVILISVEHDKSIPATCFFISKLGLKPRTIKFVKNNEELWDNVDVLVTANSEVLKIKPDNKISMKIITPYNSEQKSDFEYESFVEYVKANTED